jgi:hypothetical protein
MDMTMKTRLFASLIGAALLFGGAARATENNQWSSPTGLLFFGAGILPPPTPYGSLGMRSLFASNGTYRDQSGHKVENNFHQFVNVTTPTYIYMSNIKVLGANWGFLVAQPIMTFDGGLNIGTPGGQKTLKESHTGLGNTALEPFLLQWHWDGLFINSGVMIQVRDGDYSTSTLFNPATNYWTFGPHAAVTYITPGGFEASSSVQVDFNTTNPTTHYHTGTELKIEGALGQHIDDFTVGPVGVIYQQVQDDSAPTLTSSVRARVFSAGLSVNFMRPGFPFVLQGTLVKDFAAESHTEGFSGALRGSYTF